MNRRPAFAVLLLSLIQAAPAVAHDTWLLPVRHAVPAGTTVVLDLTSGMAFPAPETAIKPDRIARAACRLAGKTFDIAGRSTASRSLGTRCQPLRREFPPSPLPGSALGRGGLEGDEVSVPVGPCPSFEPPQPRPPDLS